MGDTTKVAVITVEDVTLHFTRGKELVLVDCLYVYKVRRNLISILSLSCNGYSVLFKKIYVFIKWNDEIIYDGSLIDNLY